MKLISKGEIDMNITIDIKDYIKLEEFCYYNNNFYKHKESNEIILIKWEEDSPQFEVNIYKVNDIVKQSIEGWFGSYDNFDGIFGGVEGKMYY